MNIAVGVDGSAESWRAMEMTVRLAEAFGGHIDVVHARSLEGLNGAGAGPAPLSETIAALEDQCHEEARNLLDHRGVSWSFSVRLGRPAEVLINFLNETTIELIVVGSRGQGLAARSVLGSTAMQLVNLSPVAVLVVP